MDVSSEIQNQIDITPILNDVQITLQSISIGIKKAESVN